MHHHGSTKHRHDSQRNSSRRKGIVETLNFESNDLRMKIVVLTIKVQTKYTEPHIWLSLDSELEYNDRRKSRPSMTVIKIATAEAALLDQISMLSSSSTVNPVKPGKVDVWVPSPPPGLMVMAVACRVPVLATSLAVGVRVGGVLTLLLSQHAFRTSLQPGMHTKSIDSLSSCDSIDHKTPPAMTCVITTPEM